MERKFSTGDVVLMLSGFWILTLIWATQFWTFTGYVDRERDARERDVKAIEDQMTDVEIRTRLVEEVQRVTCQRIRHLHGLPEGFCGTL